MNRINRTVTLCLLAAMWQILFSGPLSAADEKPAENGPQQSGRVNDPLFKSRDLYLQEVYPKKSMVETPDFLLKARRADQFSHLKPFVRMHLPALPMLGYYDELNMDLFSGSLSGSFGTQFANPLWKGVMEIELGVDSLESAENSGLTDITRGKINGTTSHTSMSAMLNLVFYPLDSMFFTIGFGAANNTLEYTFSRTEFLVDGQPKSIKSDSASAISAAVKLAFGLDVPLYYNLRLQIFTDFRLLTFSDTVGGQVSLGSGISYSL